MRESIRSVTPAFNTHRMVKEYTERLYLPAAKAHVEFARDNYRAATVLSQWKAQMRKDWPEVKITDVQIANPDRQNIQVGEALHLTTKVHLGKVDPKHVRVEAYHGEAENNSLRNPTATVLNERGWLGNGGDYLYEGSIPAAESGTYGFSVRVVPTYQHLLQPHELRLITWS
jgi:starch phosphorylase